MTIELERASDNPFPSVLLVEGDPEALADDPATGQRRLAVGTDHLLYLVDDSGVKHLVGGGLTDPMTTRGDLIIRNASNVSARLGRGSASQVLTSDGTDIAWATPTGGGTAGTSILLDYTQSSDITALTVAANTWTDVISNQSFTVAASGSIIEIAIRGMGFFNGLSGQAEVVTRLVIDSAGTPINRSLGGTTVESSAQRGNPFAGGGSLFISGLSAASHTVKPQVNVNSSNSGFYCRPGGAGGAATEFLCIQVIEHKN